MGIIMAAHAVLLSHIDRKHVTTMKPNKILHSHNHPHNKGLKVCMAGSQSLTATGRHLPYVITVSPATRHK